MFAPETKDLVEQLIQAEKTNAVKNYGSKYASNTEALEVLREEIQEVKVEWDYIVTFFTNWTVTGARSDYSGLKSWKERTRNAIKEMAQVAAVLEKISDHYKDE